MGEIVKNKLVGQIQCHLGFSGCGPVSRGKPRLKLTRKYNGYSSNTNGRYLERSFPALRNMPRRFVKAAINAANNSLSTNTWKTYKAVKKHVRECEMVIKKELVFPMSPDDVTIFVTYLLSKENLKATTIHSLLSALRTWHREEGFFLSELRPEIIKTLLSGKENEDAVMAREEGQRQPVYLEHLEVLRYLLELDENKPESEKALIWSVSTLAFWGSFRVCELLPEKSNTIDPRYDLLFRDVRIVMRKVRGKRRKVMLVDLKSPKECKANTGAVTVEIFDNQSDFCPVKAFEKYVECSGGLSKKNACFRLRRTGLAFRQRRFNDELKNYFDPIVKYGRVRGHSFRAGLSTLLAEKGFSEDQIITLGRWNSQAYKRYIKNGLLVRARYADRVSSWVMDKK